MTAKLTEDQEQAVDVFSKFLESSDKYMVIQGAAGSGKSTLVKHLVRLVKNRYKMYSLLLKKNKAENEFDFAYTATTNKAAAVLSNFMQQPVSTIHSLLKLVVVNDYSTGSTKLKPRKDYCLIYNTLIIIDEASFISDELFKIIDDTTIDCKILLIGDQYQLAPVKQKKSIMETLNCAKVYLNEIIRNSGLIMQTGAMFRETVKTGIFNLIKPDNKSILHVNGSEFKELVIQAYTDTGYSVNTAKILAWTNNKVLAYNQFIRSILNYTPEFNQGELVHTNNSILDKNYFVSADSCVKITGISQDMLLYNVTGKNVTINNRVTRFLPNNQIDAYTAQKIAAKEKNWTKYFDIKDNWLDLRPVYASTVHKSQGSTYHTVFIDLSDISKCNISTDVARMLYVAISRASHKVVLYGNLPQKYAG